MITYWQLQELRTALHDEANAFQRYVLASTDGGRQEAIASFANAAERARAAFEGMDAAKATRTEIDAAYDMPRHSVLDGVLTRVEDMPGYDANGGEP